MNAFLKTPQLMDIACRAFPEAFVIVISTDVIEDSIFPAIRLSMGGRESVCLLFTADLMRDAPDLEQHLRESYREFVHQ